MAPTNSITRDGATLRVSRRSSPTIGGWKIALHPEDIDRLMQVRQAILDAVSSGKLKLECGAATECVGRSCSAWKPLHDEAGKVVKWCGTVTDIEDRKRSETLLSLSAEKRTLEMIAKVRDSPRSWTTCAAPLTRTLRLQSRPFC